MNRGWILALAGGIVAGAACCYFILVRPADSRAEAARADAERLSTELEAKAMEYASSLGEVRARSDKLEESLREQRVRSEHLAVRAINAEKRVRELTGVLQRLADSSSGVIDLLGKLREEVRGSLADVERLGSSLAGGVQPAKTGNP